MQPRRPAHRRLLVPAVLTAALALAACGSDESSSDTVAPASTGAPATTESATTVSATAAETSGSTAETSGSSTASSAAPDTTAAPTTTAAPPTTTPVAHVVEHAMGSTEVPGDPQRVVVLDSSFLDAAIALGVTPVGATEGVPGRGLPSYFGPAAAEVEIIGDTTNPNLEQIAAMRPDLIMGAKVRHVDLYETLSQIAPTVFSESSGTNWTEQVRLTGDALNRSEDAERLLAEFEQRAAQVGEAIGADGMTATIVRFIPGQTRLYGPETFSGSVLTAVGFDLGDKGYDPAYSMAIISDEQIDMLDGDVIFATTLAGDGSSRPVFEGLWQTLAPVQAGMQFDIEDDVWMSGIGVLGANLILDDLERFLG